MNAVFYSFLFCFFLIFNFYTVSVLNVNIVIIIILYRKKFFWDSRKLMGGLLSIPKVRIIMN